MPTAAPPPDASTDHGPATGRWSRRFDVSPDLYFQQCTACACRETNVCEAWETRRRAAPCGSHDLFCDCERCAALPEKPAWMRTPQALLAMAERVVVAGSEDALALSWEMHGFAHKKMGAHLAASKSYTKAAKHLGDEGNVENKARMLHKVQEEETKAKAAAEAEAARMAPIMAAREAAANAAMEALLAEEEQEKAAAAKPRKGKGKGKGRKK